ncbi:SDR family oxidoreductase [Halotalea alkalilenta]|uniref:SDR family oxidoreductase n=1 Tax=Halotalea alkalilenta TaxID=376489 RepID=UPI000483E9B3|nr:SDR family oxidoreductase [Halotalea alkalilenta]
MSERTFQSQPQTPPGIESEMTPLPEVIRDSYQGTGKLAGKVALITGGDSGIGRAVAVHFAREGAAVAINYLSETEDAEATRDMVEREGAQCLLLPGDVREPSFCRELVERTVSEFGALNVLVNNAAEQMQLDDIREISDEQLESTFRTNIFSHFYTIKAALDHLGEGDTIICTSSINAFKGNPGLIDYSATKGAIQGLVRSLAEPLAEQGIRINAVAPGPIWTPLIPSTMGEESVTTFGAQTPMKRAGQPSEIAPAYVYLASVESSYMSGQTIHLNGGTVLNC